MAMNYSLSLYSYSHGEEERGRPPLCAAQDIELPLLLRDTLDAPSGGRVTNKAKSSGETPGDCFSEVSSRSLSYFSKHARLLNIKKAF